MSLDLPLSLSPLHPEPFRRSPRLTWQDVKGTSLHRGETHVPQDHSRHCGNRDCFGFRRYLCFRRLLGHGYGYGYKSYGYGYSHYKPYYGYGYRYGY